jgi:hypothetical protein
MRSRPLVCSALLLALSGAACAADASAQGPPPLDAGDAAALPPGVDEVVALLPPGSVQAQALADGRVTEEELRAGLLTAGACAEEAGAERAVEITSHVSEEDEPTLSFDVTGGTQADRETVPDDLTRCELLHSSVLRMVLDGTTALDGGTNVVVDEMVRLGLAG